MVRIISPIQKGGLFVGTYIVNEYMEVAFALFDELRGIVKARGFLHSALKVPFERLLSPRALRRIRDWSKSGCGPILLCLRGEVQRQGTMPSHGVSENTLTSKIL